MTPPFLTDEEIDKICEPLTQGAAQIRLLKRLGIKVQRKANGRPLVWRRDVEQSSPPASENRPRVRLMAEPNWSKPSSDDSADDQKRRLKARGR